MLKRMEKEPLVDETWIKAGKQMEVGTDKVV